MLIRSASRLGESDGDVNKNRIAFFKVPHAPADSCTNREQLDGLGVCPASVCRTCCLPATC